MIVYGGTAGGVITAITAAREGLRVALLEPRDHLGGMVTGGLSATDHGEQEVVGGYSLEFYERLGRHYRQEIEWYPNRTSPKKFFRKYPGTKTVTVFYEHRLQEKGAVKKQGKSITEIRMENGSMFYATIFVDASYEGDLMAQRRFLHAGSRRCQSIR